MVDEAKKEEVKKDQIKKEDVSKSEAIPTTEKKDELVSEKKGESNAEKKPEVAPAPKKEEVIELKNVLVIDDSKALRRVVVKYLQNKFYCNIVECDNGKEGLQSVTDKKGNFHLVLCDLMMPVMDGLTFLKSLKSMPGMQNIPVIFLTAKNDKDTVTKCAKAGANDFIIKPYDLATIAKKLDKYLKSK